MQPFARPVARLTLGHARLGLDRAAWQGKTTTWGQGRASAHSSAICLRCSLRAIGAPGRFYSTQIPPKTPDSTPKSNDNKKNASAAEPDLIEHLRAEHAKAQVAKLEKAQSDSAKVKNANAGNIKPRNTIVEDAHSHQDLPSWAESRRTKPGRKFSEIMDNLQTRALNATRTLNDVTGYTSIERIKKQNAELETALADAHDRVRTARQDYKTSHTKRAATQREVTTLLARKDSWTPLDLERFTELYRTDHVLESEVAASQETLTEAEADEQSLNQRLNAGILKRYHEEQIWSDRIRRASTWGTWGLMGMNFILFVVLQFVAEPWKRRRLIRGVVTEEKAVLEEVRVELEGVKLALEKRNQPAVVETPSETVKVVEEAQTELPEDVWSEASFTPIEPVVATPGEITAETQLEFPESLGISWQQKLKEAGLDHRKWRALAADLYSERRIDLRMRDASLLALQGALAGAAVTGSIALLLVRK